MQEPLYYQRESEYLNHNISEWCVRTWSGGLLIQFFNCDPMHLRYNEVKYFLAHRDMMLKIDGYEAASLEGCMILLNAMKEYIREWQEVSEKLGFHKRRDAPLTGAV